MQKKMESIIETRGRSGFTGIRVPQIRGILVRMADTYKPRGKGNYRFPLGSIWGLLGKALMCFTVLDADVVVSQAAR